MDEAQVKKLIQRNNIAHFTGICLGIVLSFGMIRYRRWKDMKSDLRLKDLNRPRHTL